MHTTTFVSDPKLRWKTSASPDHFCQEQPSQLEIERREVPLIKIMAELVATDVTTRGTVATLAPLVVGVGLSSRGIQALLKKPVCRDVYVNFVAR